MPCFFLRKEANEHWITLVSLVSGDSLGVEGLLVLALLTNVRVSVDGTSNATVSSPGLGIPAHRKTLLTYGSWVAAPSQAPKIILVQIYGFSGIDFCGLWYFPHRYGCDFWILLASWAKSWTIGVYFLKRIFWGSKRPYMCRRLTDFSGAVMCSGTTLPGSESQLQPQSQWSHEPWEA